MKKQSIYISVQYSSSKKCKLLSTFAIYHSLAPYTYNEVCNGHSVVRFCQEHTNSNLHLFQFLQSYQLISTSYTIFNTRTRINNSNAACCETTLRNITLLYLYGKNKHGSKVHKHESRQLIVYKVHLGRSLTKQV